MGRAGAVPPLRRGERAPGHAAAGRGARGARGLGARLRARRQARGLAPHQLADRAARHGHRAVAAAGVRRPRHQRAHVGEVVHADRLPHAARHARPARLRPPRAPDALLRLPAAAGRRRSRRDPRPRRPADDLAAAAKSSAARTATASPLPRRARDARGRPGFTRVGRALLAVDAHGALAYPHAQAAKDAEAAPGRAAALHKGDRRGAAKALRGVGANALAPKLSQAAFARHAQRRETGGEHGSWASASHLTASPDLWPEIASLTGRTGAEPHGGWIRDSLKAHLAHSQGMLSERVRAMADLAASHHPRNVGVDG